jgi:FHS family glucose/mannose:H+ symporter-like MFS transporter
MVKSVALLCSFGLGVCFSLLGAISVKLMPRLKIDQAKFGTLVTAFMSACLVASLLMGVITDRLGYRPVAVFGFALSAACILLLARSKSYAAVFASCLLFGFGAMALNTAANTLIPVVFFEGKNPAAASNFGNVAFGVGLLLAPLMVSYLFRKTSYESTVSALAAIILAPVVLAALATYPKSEVAFEFANAAAMLSEPAVLVAGLALFCYAAMDVSFSNWLPAFGKEVIAASRPEADPDAADASAQRLISVYAVSLICGRLIASQVPELTEYGGWFVASASLATALLIVGMTMTRDVRLAWLLVFVAGFASAPFFPTIVGITFSKYSPEVYGSVFGIIFAGALLGGATVPKTIGNLARGSSVQKSMRLLVPLCLLLVVLALILGRL